MYIYTVFFFLIKYTTISIIVLYIFPIVFNKKQSSENSCSGEADSVQLIQFASEVF